MTTYYPESDTLDCGCNPDWPDHRCLGGRRPSYCCCGAPDDCYCPSPAERLEMTLPDELVYPVRLILEHFHYTTPGLPLGHTTWICFDRAGLVSTLLHYDFDDIDGVIYDAHGTKEKL